MTNEDRAFVFAPLMMPFAFLSYALLTDMSGFNLENGLLSYIGSVLIVVIFGIPVVYLYEFFIAYRFYRLLLKKKRVNVFSLSVGGAFIANIPIFMVMPFSGYEAIATTFQLFSFIGFMVGLTFWYLLNFGSKGKST